jgi:hypothetical protein
MPTNLKNSFYDKPLEEILSDSFHRPEYDISVYS